MRQSRWLLATHRAWWPLIALAIPLAAIVVYFLASQ
jgi:hypothetical protein